VGEFRYPQFCPFARATEILGQRWTILILRNLAMGPQRFSDLKAGLRGISSSVLASRLDELTRLGIVQQRTLDPPAASVVYEPGPAGRALAPVMMELARWGVRFLDPPEADDQIEPAWVRQALVAFKRWEPSPEVRLELRIADAEGRDDDLVVTAIGGADGTSVENRGDPAADASLRLAPAVLLGALVGHFPVARAAADGRIEITGDPAAAGALPELFDLDRRRLGLPSGQTDAPDPTSPH
jgi:DNA-binding HxlR family transcriptional regulator